MLEIRGQISYRMTWAVHTDCFPPYWCTGITRLICKPAGSLYQLSCLVSLNLAMACTRLKLYHCSLGMDANSAHSCLGQATSRLQVQQEVFVEIQIGNNSGGGKGLRGGGAAWQKKEASKESCIVRFLGGFRAKSFIITLLAYSKLLMYSRSHSGMSPFLFRSRHIWHPLKWFTNCTCRVSALQIDCFADSFPPCSRPSTRDSNTEIQKALCLISVFCYREGAENLWNLYEGKGEVSVPPLHQFISCHQISTPQITMIAARFTLHSLKE